MLKTVTLGLTHERCSCLHGVPRAKSRISDASIDRLSICRDTVATNSQVQQVAAGVHSFSPNSVNTVDKIGSSIFSVKTRSSMPKSLAVTRSARRASNSANVPWLGLRPSLLLDFAASDTQHTPLVAAGCQHISSPHRLKPEVVGRGQDE